MKVRSLKLCFLSLLILATVIVFSLHVHVYTCGDVKHEDLSSLHPANSHGYKHDSEDPTSLDLANSHGYMLALSYSDQLTSAATNLRSFLCLAKRMGGVQVVEPFIYRSYLGMNVSANWTRELKMTDIFAYGIWKKKHLSRSMVILYRSKPSWKVRLEN